MLEDGLVGVRQLAHGRDNSLRHFVGRILAHSEHRRVFVHFARQPVRVDRERDRHRRHRARQLALDPRQSGEHIDAPQMHADTVGVGVIDQPVRRRIADLVLERRAEVRADRIGAMTIDKHAELAVGCAAGRSGRGGKDQERQGEDSECRCDLVFQGKWQGSEVAALRANPRFWHRDIALAA